MSFLKGIRELWDHLRGKGPAAAVALTLDLGEARDNKPYQLEAGGVLVETCTGDLYARINGPNGDGINLRYVRRIGYPVSSLYLTNSAQAGKSARLLLLPTGMEADPPRVRILDDLEDVEISAPQDGHVLTYEAVSLLWKNKAAAGGTAGKGLYVGKGADQNIPTNIYTTLLHDTVIFDDFSEWDAANHRFSPSASGRYLILLVDALKAWTVNTAYRIETLLWNISDGNITAEGDDFPYSVSWVQGLCVRIVSLTAGKNYDHRMRNVSDVSRVCGGGVSMNSMAVIRLF